MNDIIPRKQISISRNGGEVARSILSSGGAQPSCSAIGPPSPSMEENQLVRANDNNNSCNKLVRYKECLKNHAAAIGGNATDGCGEFMPNGEEGSLEALMCSACNCHRNFHRKEIERECPFDCYHSRVLTNGGRKFILGLGLPQGQGQGYPMIMPYEGGPIRSETDKKDDGGGRGVSARPSGVKVNKRYRTKFSQEQKEKMLNFAEMAGWRIQKLDEAAVNQFCQSIGIKRRVLKVWMHNNKQRLENNDHICS